MKIGKPFNPDACDHLHLQDLRVGMEVQADNGWNGISPWAILTVQQHSDGRLYVTKDDGAQLFLVELIDEMDTCQGCLNGLYPRDPRRTPGHGGRHDQV